MATRSTTAQQGKKSAENKSSHRSLMHLLGTGSHMLISTGKTSIAHCICSPPLSIASRRLVLIPSVQSLDCWPLQQVRQQWRHQSSKSSAPDPFRLSADPLATVHPASGRLSDTHTPAFSRPLIGAHPIPNLTLAPWQAGSGAATVTSKIAAGSAAVARMTCARGA